MQNIYKMALAELEELIAFRRDIHREPELGYREEKTASKISAELTRLGLEVKRGFAETGVLGILDTGKKGPTVILRADMDALSVQEKTGLPYSSIHPGVMHACGHDIHTAWLLGAARILVKLREEICGRVLFLFQPAEESLGGAGKVVESGIFDDYRIDGVFGAHVWPLEPGTFLLIPGAAMASSSHLRIILNGRGGHGARPQECLNPIPAAAAIIQGLYQAVGAYRDPQHDELINICSIRSGEKFNVVPDSAVIEGTIRCFSIEQMKSLQKQVRELARFTARGYALEAQVEFTGTYPPLLNDENMLKRAESAANLIGEDSRVVYGEKGLMVSEDFSYYARIFPAAYVMIGVGQKPQCQLHRSDLCPDENAIAYGAAFLAECFLGFCRKH